MPFTTHGTRTTPFILLLIYEGNTPRLAHGFSPTIAKSSAVRAMVKIKQNHE